MDKILTTIKKIKKIVVKNNVTVRNEKKMKMPNLTLGHACLKNSNCSLHSRILFNGLYW